MDNSGCPEEAQRLAQDVPIGRTQVSLAQLNQRSLDIFRRIVEGYLETGEPVGSRNLSRLLPMPLSPASVRNVMQALEESGLIFAPHTSAGRLPTEIGLRFFVDALLEIGDIDEEERRRIEAQMGGRMIYSFETDPDGYHHVVGHDAWRRRRRHDQGQFAPQAYRVPAARARARARRPGRRGRTDREPDPADRGGLADLRPWSRFATPSNARIRGRTLGQVRGDLELSRKAAQAELGELTARLIDCRAAGWGEGVGQAQTHRPRSGEPVERPHRGRGPRSGSVCCSPISKPKSDVIDLEPCRRRRRRADLHRLRE